MKKNYFFILIIAFAVFTAKAQVNISFDPASTAGQTNGWTGYMNVYETPANGGGFAFGTGWGVPDLVVFDNSDGTVDFLPNRIGDPDIYWQGSDPANGNATGNKIMEANYYVQDDDLVGQDFTFSAEILANTLDASGILDYGFTVTAFIKVYTSDYSSFTVVDSYDLSVGSFTLSHSTTDSSGTDHVQYGFTVSGPNVRLNSPDTADPGDPGYYDDDYAALGSITIGPNTLSSTDFLNNNELQIFPNPSKNNWNIESNSIISYIELFDAFGRNVLSVTPNDFKTTLNAYNLPNGLYFAKVNNELGSSTIKLIKE